MAADATLTEDDIIALVGAMPDVTVVTAGEENGAPQVSWGDTFFSCAGSTMPFATIVTQDYAGFDMASGLDREGVFRLNLAVGRDTFRDLLGYPPAAHAERHLHIGYRATDELLPHPVYAAQAWVSILNPGPRTAAQARALLAHAHGRARARHRRADATS